MMLIFSLKLHLLTIPVFFAIDMIWLDYAARNFYKTQLHRLPSPEVNWPAAFLFFLVHITGIRFFGVRPGLEAESSIRPCPRDNSLVDIAYGPAFVVACWGTWFFIGESTPHFRLGT